MDGNGLEQHVILVRREDRAAVTLVEDADGLSIRLLDEIEHRGGLTAQQDVVREEVLPITVVHPHSGAERLGQKASRALRLLIRE